MSLQANVIIAQELQRELKMCTYGSYQPSRLQPITQPSDPTNDGDVSEFEIPTKYINHFYDRLEFDVALPAAGGTYTNYQSIWTDGVTPIRRLELVSRGGQYVLDLVNPNVFTNMTGRLVHSLDEVKSYPRLGNFGAAAGATLASTVLGSTQGIMPLVGAAAAEGVTSKSLLWVGTSVAGAALTLSPADSINEPAEFFISLQETAGGSIGATVRFRIPMRIFRETVFDTSQDINFNEIMLLRVTWGSAGRVSVKAETASPVGTAAAVQPTMTIKNLYYYIAMQKNQSVIDMLNSLPEQNVMIKFPVYTKTPTTGGAGATNTITIRYNPPQGRRLLRIYWAPYNTTESGTTSYDHNNLIQSNVTGAVLAHKVMSFYTQIDGVRINQYDYDCSKFEDYHAIKSLFEGSCITSERDYARHMTFVDNFSDNYPLNRKFETDKQNWVEGLPIEKEIKYEITFVGTAINLQNYVYAITQKMLSISRDRGVIVS